jgi:hypothetical protein
VLIILADLPLQSFNPSYSNAPIGVPGFVNQNFKGKSSHLIRIQQHLLSSPRISKTRLTLQYIEQQRDKSKQVIFINTSSKSRISSAYRTVASTLSLLADVGFGSSMDDSVVAKVKQWLAENSS